MQMGSKNISYHFALKNYPPMPMLSLSDLEDGKMLILNSHVHILKIIFIPLCSFAKRMSLFKGHQDLPLKLHSFKNCTESPSERKT